MRNSTLELAKARVTISQAWQLFGLPGVPAKICRSPFREDRKPSFSIYAEGRRWRDFGTGEFGDVVDFIAKARGCDIRSAARGLIDLAALNPLPAARSGVGWGGCDHALGVTQSPAHWPVFEAPTERDLHRIAEIRGFPTVDGLRAAVKREMLYCAQMKDGGQAVRAWVLTDPLRCAAQARRLDGRRWGDINAKAKTLKCSSARWPVGAKALGDSSLVLMVEGAPDALAALTLATMRYENLDTINEIGVCAMLGAGMDIHPVAMPNLIGRHVRIVPQLDAPDKRTGELAALRWGKTLSGFGISTDVFDLAGLFGDKGGKDLNDAVAALPEGVAHSTVVPHAPLFSIFEGGVR